MPRYLTKSFLLTALGCSATLILAACGGGGGSSNPLPNPGGGGGGGGGGTTVVISGTIQFERFVLSTPPTQGLNRSAPVVRAARQVVVEALQGTTVAATTTTDATGAYSLTVPASTSTVIRAKAQMLKTGSAPTWNFQVKNNTNGDALYAIAGPPFDSGTANIAKNLLAQTGWNGTSYNANAQSSAPFAILDTVYQAKEMLLGAQASLVLPALDLFWSETNRPAGGANGGPCPDTGDINTSFYTPPNPATADTSTGDGCSPRGDLAGGIYVLGSFPQGDTDQFDQHVIAHEFGHYVEDQFSRSDSLGGSHSAGDRIDIRVAFGEGYGNAFGAMVLNDPLYRDTVEGPSRDGVRFSLDTDTFANPGQFSETSVGRILWDVFDGGTESGDSVALGFPPIFAVLIDAEKNTDAMTSIYSFSAALRSQNGTASAGIDALLTAETIRGTGAFGAGELTNGGDDIFLPIYDTLTLNAPPVFMCVSGRNGDGNAFGRFKFLRFEVSGGPRNVSFTLQGAVNPGVPTSVAATDPDVFVYTRGSIKTSGVSGPSPTEQVPASSFANGTYVVEVFDDQTPDSNIAARCMTVVAQGT